MPFREEQHARKGGKFAPKDTGDSKGADDKKQPGADAHSERVPLRIRRDEEARLDKLLGPNPSARKEQQVLTKEADKLTARAKALVGVLKRARKKEEDAAHQRGEKRKEETKAKRTHENAERAKKGLGPLKEPKKRKADSNGGGGGTRKSNGSDSSSDGGSDKSTKQKLEVTYSRLVVVRDEAFSRGVKL